MQDLRKLFVDNVKIPRHDRDLLFSYMKLLDIAKVNYKVDATDDEYNMTLHMEPVVTKGYIKVGDPYPLEQGEQGGTVSTGMIKADTVRNFSGNVLKVDTIKTKHKVDSKDFEIEGDTRYENTLGISESTLNENVANAIINIDKITTESVKLADVGIRSAKIGNLPNVSPLLTADKIADAVDLGIKLATDKEKKDKPKEKSRHYVRLFTLNKADYWQRIPAPGYGKTEHGRVVDISKDEYMRAFEIFISMNNISEATYNNRTFIRVEVGDETRYFERKTNGIKVEYSTASLELFEQAFSDSVFIGKTREGTILKDTV